jgi:type I restriction enzyme S subunit
LNLFTIKVYITEPLYQNLVKGSNRAAQGGFNKDDLNVLMFPLPPLEEQHRIVAKIEELLPYVDQLAK